MRQHLLWLSAALLVMPAAAQDLRGHGGPVSALSAGDGRLVSGGFDGRVISWDPAQTRARRVEMFHDGNVTAVALTEGGFVSAGQDGRVALWRDGEQAPVWSTPAEVSSVSALAVGPSGIAAGFFDGRIARIDPASGAVADQAAHVGRVSGLAFLPDGALASVGADMRFARWGANGQLEARTSLPDLPNGLALAGRALAVPFAEGTLRLLSRDGELLPERFLTDRPLVAVAGSPEIVATAAVDGAIWLLDPPTLEHRAQLPATGGPIWALALDGPSLFAAGAQGLIRRFSVEDGTALGQGAALEVDAVDDGSRGAEIWRACAICHSLEPDDHTRAGPSLHGVFGRRIASVEGYSFSPALREMEIVWTPQTVAELFEFGPDAYTPGSRMPDQRVGDADDRQALVEFLGQFSP